MKNFLKGIIFFTVSLICWITVLEVATRYLINKNGDSLDFASNILEIDEVLGWKQITNFNGRFLNIPLKTNELGFRDRPLNELISRKNRIAILGPSSTFGWGIARNESYSAILENTLKNNESSDIAVLNAGEIGFSTFQGLKLLNQEGIRNFNPNIYIFAYGINDIDRHRFFFENKLEDKIELSRKKGILEIYLQKTLGLFSFPQYIVRKGTDIFKKQFCGHLDLGPKKRVSFNDYYINLKEMIEKAKANKAQVILMTTPYLLKSHIKASSFTPLEEIEYFRLGIKSFRNKKWKTAIDYFLKVAIKNNVRNEVFYYLAASYSKIKNCSKANEYLEIARKNEPQRIYLDVQKINEIIRKVSIEEDVFLSDAYKIIDKISPVETAFVDPVHPSFKGQYAIAQNLASIIMNYKLLKKIHK